MTINGSVAQALVLRMKAQGHSYSAIGRALGRDSSAISQIASGKRGPNYGKHYGPALARAEAELKNQAAGAPAHPIVQPARRMKGKGRRQEPARVRQPTSRGVGKQWGVSTTKRQATRSGARGLTAQYLDAIAKGRKAGVSLSVSPKVNGSQSGGKTGTAPQGGWDGKKIRDQEIRAELDAAFTEHLKEAGGHFTNALAAWLVETGRVESIEPGQIHSIELRTWTP
jgi:hypothetical protein